MQCSTKRAIVQLAQIRLHALVVLSILVLALLGRMPESQAGWITCPPQVVMLAGAGRRRPGRGVGKQASHRHRRILWRHLTHTWHIPLLRSLLLWGLWELSGQVGPAWVRLMPWVVWGWLRILSPTHDGRRDAVGEDRGVCYNYASQTERRYAVSLPRRKRQKRQQKTERDWKQIAFYVLSGLVAISMAFAYVISYLAGH